MQYAVDLVVLVDYFVFFLFCLKVWFCKLVLVYKDCWGIIERVVKGGVLFSGGWGGEEEKVVGHRFL